jgi:hypothetical protein
MAWDSENSLRLCYSLITMFCTIVWTFMLQGWLARRKANRIQEKYLEQLQWAESRLLLSERPRLITMDDQINLVIVNFIL